MLGIEINDIFYFGLMGGFIGGAFTAFAHRQTLRIHIRLIENCWGNDLARVQYSVENLEKKVSIYEAEINKKGKS